MVIIHNGAIQFLSSKLIIWLAGLVSVPAKSCGLLQRPAQAFIRLMSQKKYAFSFNQVSGVVLVQFVNVATSTSVSLVVGWIMGPHPWPAPIAPNSSLAG